MRVLEFLQSSGPDPDYEVAGICEFHEGLGSTCLLVREIRVHDDGPGGDESGCHE